MPLAKEARPTREVDLKGPGGNAFCIMGLVSSIIKQLIKAEILPEGEDKEYTKRAMSGDYENLLKVSREYVDIVDTSEPDEDEDEEEVE